MKFWISTIVFVLCSTTGLLLMKDALNLQVMEGISLYQIRSLFRLLTHLKFLVGFAFYVAGFLVWLSILSRHELSMAFPIVSGSLYIGLLIGSALWLHEGIGLLRVTGVILILAGILLVSFS